MSDFDTAIQRLTAWVRDYGEAKPKEFIGDVSLVLLAAKDTYRLQRELDEAKRDRMRGTCKLLSLGDKCECGLCAREKEIERLQATINAICDSAEYCGELGQICTEDCPNPPPVHVWQINLDGRSQSLRAAAEKASQKAGEQ
jgi:hypothetical protein